MGFGWVGRVLGHEFGRAGRAISQAGRLYYDYLALSILVSVYWYVFAFLPVTYLVILPEPAIRDLLASETVAVPVRLIFMVLSYLPAALIAVLLAAPVTAVANWAMHALIQRDGFYPRELFTQIPRFYKKTVATAGVAIVIILVLAVDFVIVLFSASAILKWLSVLFGYFLVFVVLSMQYLFPFIVQQTVSVWKTLQRAALVALDNVIVSLLLALVGAILFWLSFRIMIPMVLIFMGYLAALHNYALIEILKKYDDPPPGAGGNN